MALEIQKAANKREPSDGPEQLTQALKNLGPAYSKLGQYLALRPDLVGEKISRELLKLRDKATPISFDSVREIVAADLGGKPEDFFSWISPRPMYAGSFVQVHRASVKNGDQVAIKVQHPDAAAKLELELGQTRAIHRLLETAGATSFITADQIAEELKHTIRDELDFALELRNLTRFSQLSRDDGRSRIPQPYSHLSGARVLTVELLGGVPLPEVLGYQRSDRMEYLTSLRVNSAELANQLLSSALHEIFELRFFQANAHPANVLVLPSNEIGFINFSQMRVIDPNLGAGMMRLLRALSTEDVAGTFDAFSELVIAGPTSDLNRLRVEFYNEIERTERSEGQRVPTNGSRVSLGFSAILRTAPQYGFTVPASIVSLCSRLQTSQILAHDLSEGAQLADRAKLISGRLQLRQIIDTFSIDSLQPVILDGLNLFTEGPRTMRRLLADQVDGRLVLRMRTVESQEDRQVANARARLIASTIVSVGLAFLIGATRGLTFCGLIPLSWPLLLLLVLIWAWIAFQWRNLR